MQKIGGNGAGGWQQWEQIRFQERVVIVSVSPDSYFSDSFINWGRSMLKITSLYKDLANLLVSLMALFLFPMGSPTLSSLSAHTIRF